MPFVVDRLSGGTFTSSPASACSGWATCTRRGRAMA